MTTSDQHFNGDNSSSLAHLTVASTLSDGPSTRSVNNSSNADCLPNNGAESVANDDGVHTNRQQAASGDGTIVEEPSASGAHSSTQHRSDAHDQIPSQDRSYLRSASIEHDCQRADRLRPRNCPVFDHLVQSASLWLGANTRRLEAEAIWRAMSQNDPSPQEELVELEMRRELDALYSLLHQRRTILREQIESHNRTCRETSTLEGLRDSDMLEPRQA